ncbi:MAG: histidinol-phosphatase [Ruminococcus sp.]|nr:histidinol-phosphatase [Ruminococcus sp.]
MIIDMHSHILPGIDDGSRNVEESVKLLDSFAERGIDLVVATPHFYCEEQSINRFLEKRNKAYEELKPHLKPEHPKILLGAEVLYSPILVGNDDISKLAIEGTDFVLFEMPYQRLTEDIIENVSKIVNFMDIKLLIAHIERYLYFTSFSELSELMDLDVIGQINVKSLMKSSSKRACFKLIKNGYVHALGTDYHRIDRPCSHVDEAYKILDKKFGEGYTDHLMHNALEILKNESLSYFYR